MKELEKMDHKYKGKIFKNDGTPVPGDEWIVFRAKDLALPAAMSTYINRCKELGCKKEFVHAFIGLYSRVINFQNAHPERCKIPD